MKKLDEGNRPQVPVPVHAMNSYFTCEVCGDCGHSGNDCPETREDAAYINNTGFRPQGGRGWGQSRPQFQGGNNYNSNFNSNFNSNQLSLRDLVFGQAKINKSLNKKLAANDKILESIHAKVETLSSAHKNQLSFNKMIETQLAQIAAVVPVSENGKIPGQPESPIETANMVSTGWGNLPRQTSNHAGRTMHPRMNAWGGLTAKIHGDPGVPMITCSIFDQSYTRALCDLGSRINIMAKVIFEQLQYHALSQT